MWQQHTLWALLESKLWILCTVVEIALCTAIIRRNLLSSYPYLFGLASYNCIRDMGLASFSGVSSATYPRLWTLTLPILMALQVATVQESYGKLTGQYPRLEVFASRLMGVCLSFLVLAACVSAAWGPDPLAKSVLQSILFAYRYLAFVLAGCLALPCLVLARLPKPNKKPARNIRLHLWILVAYFGVYSACLLCVNKNVLGQYEKTVTLINIFMLFAHSCLYGLWAFLLTPEGEISEQWPELQPELAAMIDRNSEASLRRQRRLEERMLVKPKS